jgi:flagellar basal-body rod modification protein FlgD
VISSDFETFLKTLTAQLRHQDPLNPLESNDFAVQLATFSGVEQQVLTNDLLTELTQAQDAGAHAGWIGLDALAPGPARFDGAPLTLEFAPQAGAATATLFAEDAAGREVGRYPVDPISGRVVWAGTDASGGPLPAGPYRFEIMAADADGATSSVPVASYARVSEVRPGPEGTRVVLSGGAEVAAEEVLALRAPPPETGQAFP